MCEDQVEIFNFPVENFVPEQREGAHNTTSLQAEGNVAVENVEQPAASLFVFPHEGVVETEVKVTDCQAHHCQDGNHRGFKISEGHSKFSLLSMSLLKVNETLTKISSFSSLFLQRRGEG